MRYGVLCDNCLDVYNIVQGGILVFSLSRQPSFTALKFWLEEIRSVSFSKYFINNKIFSPLVVITS